LSRVDVATQLEDFLEPTTFHRTSIRTLFGITTDPGACWDSIRVGAAIYMSVFHLDPVNHRSRPNEELVEGASRKLFSGVFLVITSRNGKI